MDERPEEGTEHAYSDLYWHHHDDSWDVASRDNMSDVLVPKGLKKAGQELVDSFFKSPKKPKEPPVRCPRCLNYTFASFGACHVCDNPVDENGKGTFKYRKKH